MTKYREILRLSNLGLSQQNIADSCGVSKKTVNRVLKKAKELIYNYLNQHKLVLRKEDIMVLVSNLADSSIEIKVRVYTLTPAYGAILKAQLNEYILDSFKEANIEIPYQYINIINK